MHHLDKYKHAKREFLRNAPSHLIEAVESHGTRNEIHTLHKKGLVTIERACEFCITMYNQVSYLNRLLMDALDDIKDSELQRALDHAEYIQELCTHPTSEMLDQIDQFEEYQRQNAAESVSDEDQSDLNL